MDEKVVLLILDGWGVNDSSIGNYVEKADTPFIDGLLEEYPNCLNKASGNSVGLPVGVQGNSEVGHLHMGAGRIVPQLYKKINDSINNGSFFGKKELKKSIQHVKEEDSDIHIMGLCSDAGVHAHINHLKALLDLCEDEEVSDKTYVHFFADGRDVHEKSAKEFINELDDYKAEIATLTGRFYAMDRDDNWSRTKKAYDAIVNGEGFKASTAVDAVENGYERGAETDYYIEPTVIEENNNPKAKVKDDDVVIFFNFRTDRPKQLTKALIEEDFKGFERNTKPSIKFVPLTPYFEKLEDQAVFKEEKISHNLGKVIADNDLRQLRMAETEKYAHVTYFFNSQEEEPYEGEERIMIESPSVKSYDKKPEMSAYEVTSKAIKKIKEENFSLTVINLANPDLVGHSGKEKPIIEAVEVVDECVKEIVNTSLDQDHTCLITSDHGNAEECLYEDGGKKPSHSSNPVPFILVSDEVNDNIFLRDGGQIDVAPTIIDILDLEKPEEMTGESLIDRD